MASTRSQQFSEACGFVLHFGKYSGMTLARIGSSNDGLKYLDWMIDQKWVLEPLLTHLHNYLHHPAIDMRLSALLED
jgi:hypothetical protein